MARTKCIVFLGNEEKVMEFLVVPRKGDNLEFINTYSRLIKKTYKVTNVVYRFTKEKNELEATVEREEIIIYSIEVKGL